MRRILNGTIVTLCVLGACGPEAYMAKIDRMPPEQRSPEWDQTRQLMARQAPAVG